MVYSKKKNFLFHSFALVFRDPLYAVLALSLAFNLFAVYYFLLYKITTFEVFLTLNTALYNWLSIGMTVLISLSFGAAVSLLIWQWKQQRENNAGHTGNTFIASFFGALSIGCPTCGAFLASLLGIGGGLAAFPFQGLEIKVISLGLLGFALFTSAKSVSDRALGICKSAKKPALFEIKKGHFIFNPNKETITPLLPIFIGFVLLFSVGYLPALADKFDFRVSFQPTIPQNQSVPEGANAVSSSEVLHKINPKEGYVLNAVYGDIGPKLLAAGAIDFEKMKSLYEKAGQPLTDEQIKILTQGSDERIKISQDSSYFLLNFFWALGLANKNPILDEGPISQYGEDQIGRFASTGGWSLGKVPATEFFSKFSIIPLDGKQQAVLEDFAFNSYRPCCSNPTGFPDCNHGMAALALGELMVSQGASVDELFEAFKYVNAFWFPQTYFDIANYFQAKEGKDWPEVSGRVVAGKDYSTPQGWGQVRNWLKSNNLIEEAPSGGGSCGV